MVTVFLNIMRWGQRRMAIAGLALALLYAMSGIAAQPVQAANVCSLPMRTGITGSPSVEHTKYVTVSSSIDLANRYNQGQAVILYTSEYGGYEGFSKNSWMQPWGINVWGVSTTWSYTHPHWAESWRWKINYYC